MVVVVGRDLGKLLVARRRLGWRMVAVTEVRAVVEPIIDHPTLVHQDSLV